MACRLPARSAILANEDWQRTVDELEEDLLSCAAQVLDCIERQGDSHTVMLIHAAEAN